MPAREMDPPARTPQKNGVKGAAVFYKFQGKISTRSVGEKKQKRKY